MSFLIPLKKLIKELDKMWAEVIKARDGHKCVRCGKIEGLNAAHIFSRSLKSVRWSLWNGITLCGGCHIFWAHKNPVEFTEFVKQRLGEQKYELLRQEARCIVKVTREYLERIKFTLQSYNF